MGEKEEAFKTALQGKRFPILTLDNKWHKLFTQAEPTPSITVLEERLNELLRRQGKLNTESKDIRNLKRKLMKDIVALRDEAEQTGQEALEKKLSDNSRLVNDCNEKLTAYEDELHDLPKEIERVNYELMLQTMAICYEKIKDNSEEIEEIAQWITQIRVELKKKVVRKQEKEQKNHELYSYMHAVFGADVIEIFDMKYNPEEHRPKLPLKKIESKEEMEKVDKP